MAYVEQSLSILANHLIYGKTVFPVSMFKPTKEMTRRHDGLYEDTCFYLNPRALSKMVLIEMKPISFLVQYKRMYHSETATYIHFEEENLLFGLEHNFLNETECDNYGEILKVISSNKFSFNVKKVIVYQKIQHTKKNLPYIKLERTLMKEGNPF